MCLFNTNFNSQCTTIMRKCILKTVLYTKKNNPVSNDKIKIETDYTRISRIHIVLSQTRGHRTLHNITFKIIIFSMRFTK